jgi:acyl transferase domain-containing protein
LKARLEAVRSISQDLDIIDLAYTLGCRSHLPVRGYLTATQATLKDNFTEESLIWTNERRTELPLTWIFNGQSAQWLQMGKELIEKFPAFLACIRELDAVLNSLDHTRDWTLENELMEPLETSRINDVTRSQPICTAIQISIIRLLKGAGLMPAVVTGHSSGGIAAAYAVGLMTAEQAIAAAYYCGYAIGQSGLRGSMMAVGMGYETAKKYIEETCLVGKIVVGCINSPESITLSGDETAINTLLEKLKSEQKFARKLATGGHAYHSLQMAAVADKYICLLEQAFKKLGGKMPRTSQEVTWISSVDNTLVTQFPGAEYWTANLTSPVRFSDAFQTILTTGKFGSLAGIRSLLARQRICDDALLRQGTCLLRDNGR